MKVKFLRKNSEPPIAHVWGLLLFLTLFSLSDMAWGQNPNVINEQPIPKSIGGLTELAEPMPFPFPEGKKIFSEGFHPIKGSVRYVYNSKQLTEAESKYVTCLLQKENLAFAVETSTVMKIIMIDCKRDVNETALFTLIDNAEAMIAQTRQTAANSDAAIEQLCNQ